jgi:carbamoyl-phosphate synthase/aspartate carbamoyltransferase/dihydroorotase
LTTLLPTLERPVLELPGLIDPHVHLREPGATHKEDFTSGTAAALAGGFTTVLAMPNTQPALINAGSLEPAEIAARAKARCDYGIFLGAGEANAVAAADLAHRVCGLKVYMDQTYGPLRMRSLPALIEHFKQWPKDRVIACHAETHSLAIVLGLAQLFERRVHICHVSRAVEIQLIRLAKERGTRVTCEVTPHHLFLSEDDISTIGAGRSEVRPVLAGPADVTALWEAIEVIDCFATDHAPHTLEEKDGEDPPPGFPGLETALGLFMRAVDENRLTLDQLLARMHTNPRHIYDLPEQAETVVEFDPDTEWEVCGGDLMSRCGWTPFEGMRLRGTVRRVVLRGKPAYEDGSIVAPAGGGRNLMTQPIPA